MSLAPLLDAPAHIQVHAFAAVLAVALGPVVIYRRRRDRIHKVVGYIWVLAMALTALSSFAITNFGIVGPFSPVHLLAVLALWSLVVGLRHAFARRIAAHERVMRSLYWNGLMVASAFNFLPGRVVNRVFFNDARELGYAMIVLVLAGLAAHALRRKGSGRSITA